LKHANPKASSRCAIYARVSTEHGPEQEFNSLDNQREASEGLTDGKGKATGGGLISRGHLYKILSNPIYIGGLTHKDQVHAGLHAAIVDHESWNRVQRQVLEQLQTERAHATTLTPCLPVSSLMIAGTE
jgi:Recombinase